MNYHNITTCDMKNGDGLRVVLWVSGCSHHCKNCQNPQTWDINSGIPFDEAAEKELFDELGKDYHQGLTFSGGDPCNPNNFPTVAYLADKAKKLYPKKDIWVYTGFELPILTNNVPEFREKDLKIFMKSVDVIIDGPFIDRLKDNTLHWRGSSNQSIWRKSPTTGHFEKDRTDER